MTTSTSTSRIESFADGLTLHFDERGSSGSRRPMLILHGGAGPQSVTGISEAFSQFAHVITPTHPGFGGTPRPDWFDSVDDLALAYLDLLERLDLHDVMVIGFSIGGWIASEIAVRDTSRLSSLVIVDGGGIDVPGHEIADVFSITPDQLMSLSYHNPAAFRIDASTLTPQQIAGRTANFKTLAVYSGARNMRDPKLQRRLHRVTIPTLVIWGASDGVIDPDYGRAYAQSFPNARFELIPESGHMPQFEQPQHLLTLVHDFANSLP